MGFALRNIYLPQYSYDDYCHWEGDWELIEGIPYSMSPSPFIRHQSILTKIIVALNNALKKCKYCEVGHELDWIVSNNTVVRPDAMVYCGKFDPDSHLTFPPEIIFEILSDSTGLKDKTVKFDLYSGNGVKYYIIVNPKQHKATVYKLEDDEYINVYEGEKFKFLFELKNCSFKFNFSEIWKKF